MNKRKEIMRKMIICLFLVNLLWGCGLSGQDIENEQSVEVNKQVDEATQTKKETSDYSEVFADATMKEKISEACKGEPDKEHLEALTVLKLTLTTDDEPIAVLDDLALLPGLEQLYIDVQPECGKADGA